MEELEESVWSVVRQENERKDQGEGVQDSGKTSTDVRGRNMGVEEWTGKEIWGRRNENDTMDVRSYEAGQDQKWKNKRDNESFQSGYAVVSTFPYMFFAEWLQELAVHSALNVIHLANFILSRI